MRSIANASLNLGLLNAPIKLFPASSNLSEVKFNLCGPEGEDVEQVYRIKGADTIVGTRADCERKFDDHLIKKETIEKVEEESLKDKVQGAIVDLKKTMAIEGFIPVKNIPFERTTDRYYIGPGKGSDQALATIQKAMEKKKLAAVTKYCLRGRQGCFVLFMQDGVMNAVRLAFAASINEVTDEVRVESAPTKPHVDAAITLIEEYVDEDAKVLSEMTDTLVARKQELVEQASAGKAIELTPVKSADGQGDLMDILKADLARVKKGEKVAA